MQVCPVPNPYELQPKGIPMYQPLNVPLSLLESGITIYFRYPLMFQFLRNHFCLSQGSTYASSLSFATINLSWLSSHLPVNLTITPLIIGTPNSILFPFQFSCTITPHFPKHTVSISHGGSVLCLSSPQVMNGQPHTYIIIR